MHVVDRAVNATLNTTQGRTHNTRLQQHTTAVDSVTEPGMCGGIADPAGLLVGVCRTHAAGSAVRWVCCAVLCWGSMACSSKGHRWEHCNTQHGTAQSGTVTWHTQVTWVAQHATAHTIPMQ